MPWILFALWYCNVGLKLTQCWLIAKKENLENKKIVDRLINDMSEGIELTTMYQNLL